MKNQKGESGTEVVVGLMFFVVVLAAGALVLHFFNTVRPVAPTPAIQAACDQETAHLHAKLSEASRREISEFVLAEAVGAAVGGVAAGASGGKVLDGVAIGAGSAGTAEVLLGEDHSVSQKRAAFRTAYKACIERHRAGPPK